MKRLYRSPIIWWVLAATGLFLIAARIVPNRELLEAVRLLQLAVSVVLVYAYAEEAWKALSTHSPDSVDFLTVGIFLGWVAHSAVAALLLLWRFSGQEPWLVNNDLNGYFIVLTVVSGFLHALAPRTLRGHIPSRNKLIVGAVIGAAVLSFGILFIVRPNVEGLTTILRPWLEERDSSYGR